MLKAAAGLLALSLGMATPALADVTLRGSRGSMERQHQVARAHDYTFLRSPAQVRDFVEAGRLVEVRGNGDYEVARGVSFPYARQELLTFVERLSEQYRGACGERLVVTSLTRPASRQPGNAHPLSVHPAGMAVDLRISDRAACRSWLEGTLLSLEERELLDVTRERNPPHYHVAVFPEPYMAHVQRLVAEDSAAAAQQSRAVAAMVAPVRAAVGPTGTPAEPGDGELGRALLVALLSVALVVTLSRRSGVELDGE
jgi:hypothetical protein